MNRHQFTKHFLPCTTFLNIPQKSRGIPETKPQI